VLVVEDSPYIADLSRHYLERAGQTVDHVASGRDVLPHARAAAPDLVVLDLMLPGMDGLEVCREAKNDPKLKHVPIVMVSAKGEESDVVLGLGLGADDYITKPFSPKELVARVRAVLRRTRLSQAAEEPTLLERDGLVIDADKHRVTVHGEPVELTATEFRLLRFLAMHPGRVFTRDNLVTRVIGENAIVTDRNIDVHIGSIRRKLGAVRDHIATIRGVGYRFREAD
jgi:DNA-binding response OmpR family regulator